MSREAYVGAGGGNRSPRSVRRVGELPTVDRSPSRSYPSGGRGSPIGRKGGIRQTRSGNNSPDHGGYGYHHQSMGSPYYSRDDDLGSPMLEERGRSMASASQHHRSRSASRPTMGSNPMTVRYQSLDRGGGTMIGDPGHEREFMPIREPRERSLDRSAVRDRSLERGLYLEDELYGPSSRSARQSPHLMGREPLIGELQHQNTDLQRELGNLKKELELTNQKLGSSMHSIKTFWSPELKKERAMRKEESAKYSLINDQLKLLSSENQKQAMLVRQLEEELRMRMRGPSIEMQQQMEVLFQENEHLTREIAILRDTIKELELRIETQKQTLQARDESIKKLLEMLQNKGMGKEEERQMFQQMQAMAQKQLSSDVMCVCVPSPPTTNAILRQLDGQLDEFRVEIQRRDQEILAMSAKMKTLEEQHQDYQRHIAVLKESLCAKEEHYNMLQADVEELRQRLDEKNRLIEKKTQQTVQAQQDRNRMNSELTELKEHMDIKDRKINVLQRKLDLHEATKKMQQGAKTGEDTTAIKRQLDDQSKKIEEQSKKIEEQRRNVDNKLKQINEREKALQEMDKQLQRRKDQLDQLENQLKKSGGNAAAVTEMNKELDNMRQQLQKAKEESQRSGAEMERLLQLVQMSQEEQNAKEKTIMELQQALKNAQAKMKTQQQAAAQATEQRKKEEIPRTVTLEEVVTTNEFITKTPIHSQTPSPTDKELTLDDFEDIMDLVEVKDKRIHELEDALRESVSIATEREDVLQQEEQRRKHILEKVSKLEQRLLSLQTAQAMRCHSCRPLVSRLNKMEASLSQLVTERKRHLQEVSDMKQEALEAAISEKDAHVALLEMSGIRNERQATEVEQLRKDKLRLMEKLKEENELSISLIEECQLNTSIASSILYVEDSD